MNISVKCNVSLSDKLKKLLTDGKISLILGEVKDGKGIGTLNIDCDSEINEDDLLSLGETFVILTPTETSDYYGSDNSNKNGVSGLFLDSTRPGKKSPVIKKIAAIDPEVEPSEAFVEKENVKIPEPFKQLKNPKCVEYIRNFDELMSELNKAKTKQSIIDPSSAQTDRERAVLIEQKEREEALDIPAYIVNDKVGALSVGDLGIALPLNIPFDLSRISARRVAASKDLIGLMRSGYVKIIDPQETEEYKKKILMEEKRNYGLKTYGREAAAASFETEMEDDEHASPMIQDDAEETNEGNMDQKTEEEETIINLTQNMPTERRERATQELNGTRITQHTSSNPSARTSSMPKIAKKF